MNPEFDPNDLIDDQAVFIIDEFLNRLRRTDDMTLMQLIAVLTRHRRLGHQMQTSFEPNDTIAWLIDDLAVKYTASGKPATRPAELVANARSFYELARMVNSPLIRPEVFYETYVPTMELAEQLLNLFYIQEGAPMLVTPVIYPTHAHFAAVLTLDQEGRSVATRSMTIAPLKEFVQTYKVS